MSERTATKWTPTLAQQKLLEAAHNGGLNRTITAICLDADVDRVTFYKAIKVPEFAAAWEDVAKSQLRAHLPGVMQALVTAALGGDVQAIAKFLSLAGLKDAAQRVEVSATPAADLKTWFAEDADSLKLYMALEARKNCVVGTDGGSMGDVHPGEPSGNGNGHK